MLETRTVEPVGSATPIPVDIRLVAATNRDLRAWVDAGKFREDLYFRLNVVDINLPPLRERQGDLPLLCDAFVREFNPQLGRGIIGIAPEAMTALAAYPWPGNVRELRNTIERMMVLAHGDHLTLEDVPKNIREGRAPVNTGTSTTPATEPEEATLIRRALFETKGNRTAAAKRLGIPLRTLYRRIKSYGLEDVK